MKRQSLSVRRFLIAVCFGAFLTAFAVLAVLYLLTGDFYVIVCGLLLSAALFVWAAVFVRYFQKKLFLFTNSLCQTLDKMIDGRECPVFVQEEETLLARSSHRLERLYNIMQESQHRVEKEKMELQSLVSDISHQTKTPIANLKMLNDTLLSRPVSEEKRQEFLQAIGSQLDKLDFLIQAMVKTSRLETGVITLEKQETRIFETLVTAINSILALMEKKKINLSIDCPEDLTVAHDSRWTGEALFNLLDNAVKYTADKGKIYITVQKWELYLKIDVTDTGRGIPECAHAAIFKRFYREESVHDIDGIGIGLYLARKIITMQGGYIKVISEEGKGSTFSVFLPYK